MAKTYGTVATFTAGSVLTAAQLNVASGAVNNLIVPAAARALLTGTQALTSATAISWDSISASGAYDTDSMWSSGAKTRLTVTTPGIYVVVAGLLDQITVANCTAAELNIRRNGITVATYRSATTIVINDFFETTVTWTGVLNASDYVEVQPVFTGGTHTLLNDGRNSFSATWIGRTS